MATQEADDRAGTTSADNLKLSERFVAAVMGGRLDELGEMVHPDFELHHSSTVPYAGTYKGIDGFLRFVDKFMGTYDLERLDLVGSFLSEDGSVILELALRGKLKGTESIVDTTMLEKWEFKDGKVWRITPHYFDPNPVGSSKQVEKPTADSAAAAEKGPEPGYILTSCIEGDWRAMAPGIEMRVLRACEASGAWAVLYKVKGGTTATPHMHYGTSDSYLISGRMEGGGKVVLAGDYTHEPNSNRRHEATYFPEDSLLLYIHHGPLMYLDEAGNFKAMMDATALQDLVEAPVARAS